MSFKRAHDNVKDPAIGTALRIVNGVVVGELKGLDSGLFISPVFVMILNYPCGIPCIAARVWSPVFLTKFGVHMQVFIVISDGVNEVKFPVNAKVETNADFHANPEPLFEGTVRRKAIDLVRAGASIKSVCNAFNLTRYQLREWIQVESLLGAV